MAQQEDEWFSTWFDSPYYPMLHNNRNLQEAQLFADTLLVHLHPKPHNRILDLARGQARHSAYINQKGFDITGTHLPAKNIAYAGQSGNVRGLRQVYKPGYSGFVLNLLTSFGYFNNETRQAVAIADTVKSLKLKMVQLRLATAFGDYNLNPFVREESDRRAFELKK